MEMRVECLIRVLHDGRNQLPPSHVLAAPDFDRLKMRIERANLSPFVVFVKVMLDDDDVPPQPAAVFGEDYAAVGHCQDILAEISVAAATAVPIFSCMNPPTVLFRESRGDVPAVVSFARGLVCVRAFAVGVADGKVEPVSGRGLSVKKVVERVAPV